MGGLAAREDGDHVGEREGAHVVDRLGGLCAEVRGDDDPVGELRREQGTLVRGGVSVEGVCRVAGERAVMQCLRHRCLVDQVAAGGVDQHGPRPHADEALRIDESLAPGGVQRDDVGRAEQIVDRGGFRPPRPHCVVGHERIGGEHARAEAAQARGDTLADSAEADDAHRGGAELPSAPHAPVARAHPAVAVRHEPQRGQHETDRMIGHGVGVRAGGVRHGDSAIARGSEVDRLGAHSVAGDDLELRGCGEVRIGDGAGSRDPGIGAVQQ
ncbi:hypothetical protein RN51_02523 [Microbacterium oxydans]|uniref:Uncharacterized protein n=1 Tax=Microbacterium oxydans TaxID=82380 RepID=A0A0F0KHE0_9MICO|nr:hypothetical protein RN51_02523 [Microbacterium oxydans]